MDPVTLILTALATGAAKVAGDVIPDAYIKLKELIQKKFEGQPIAEAVLEAHEKNPEKYAGTLEKNLVEAGVDKDDAVLDLAEKLLEQLESKKEGTTTIIGQNAKGIIGQTVTNATITGNIS